MNNHEFPVEACFQYKSSLGQTGNICSNLLEILEPAQKIDIDN